MAARAPGSVIYNTRAVRALDQLATTRITRLAPARRRELFRAVEAAETAAELFHRHRAGAPAVPHPIALTPFIVPSRMLPSLARLADLVHRVQAHAPALWRADAGGFRALCPVSDTTAAWLQRDAARPPAPWELLIRPDVGLEAGARGGLDAGALRDQRDRPRRPLQPRGGRPDPARRGLPARVHGAGGARSHRSARSPRPRGALGARGRPARGPAAPAGGRVRGGCPAARRLQRGAAPRRGLPRGGDPRRPGDGGRSAPHPERRALPRPHGRHGLPGPRARGHRAADAAGARRLPRPLRRRRERAGRIGRVRPQGAARVHRAARARAPVHAGGAPAAPPGRALDPRARSAAHGGPGRSARSTSRSSCAGPGSAS